jgi:phosphatidylcholine synthase
MPMTSRTIAAWAVHLYTGLGALLGLLALDAAARASYGAAFGWLALAMAIDCTDGTLARWAQVKSVLPNFDGGRLDDIVDYLTYVFVPIVLAWEAEGILPEGPERAFIASLPLLASGYGFCQVDAKTPDHFFKGFPSYWNVVVFYLYCLRASTCLNAAVLVLFSILVFVPVRYLYPSRTATARTITIVLGMVWAIMVLTLLQQFPHPSRGLALMSLFFPAYYLGFSVYLHFAAETAPKN